MENMIEVLKKKRIVIYGTGHVGHKFYKVLKQNGLEKQIVCFARTGDVQAGETLDGTEVHCFEERTCWSAWQSTNHSEMK